MTPNRSTRRRVALALGVFASVLGAPHRARAWDPGATHQGMVDRAVQRSAMHRRWMDATELQRGLFSPLRIEPDWLSKDELRLIDGASRAAPADNGAAPLGGPGACPGADAPLETQRYCVRGDTWEATALGWIRLGLVAETTPNVRMAHHFLDREDPTSSSWHDEELPRFMLRRRQIRANGASLATGWTATGFDGSYPSAVAWIERDAGSDPLAPASLYEHLERASMAETSKQRDHHFALALIATGALLHVLQDAAVPAHARGDASAFFMPLSTVSGDRGLPLQEYVRVSFGRFGLPGKRSAGEAIAATGEPLADSVRGHLLGDRHYEGIARIAGDRFFSESSVPRPVSISPDLSPTQAAAKLLGDTRLDPVERDGAYLEPWPADDGYLRTKTGRVLSAWSYDGRGRIEAYLDEAAFRQQAVALIPAAIDVSRSVLDHLWPAWPGPVRMTGPVLELEVPDTLREAQVVVMAQDERGDRRQLQQLPLTPGSSHRIVGLPELDTPGARVVVVLVGTRISGDPYVVEQTLAATRAPVTTHDSTEPSNGVPAPDDPKSPEGDPVDDETDDETDDEPDDEPDDGSTANDEPDDEPDDGSTANDEPDDEPDDGEPGDDDDARPSDDDPTPDDEPDLGAP